MRVLLIAAICISFVLFAGETFSESDEICCTWVNTKYESGTPPQKLMFNYDGTFATYITENSAEALSRGMFQIVEKWNDSEGYIWYKIMMQDPAHGKKYKLARISQNGNKLEFVCKSDKYPARINSNEPDYCNYLRASMDK
jgi:hypothetical protein